MLNNFLTPVIIETDPLLNGNARVQGPLKILFQVTNVAERIVSNNTIFTRIVQNNELLAPNLNPRTLSTEKNLNYLSKSLLATAMITYYFFNGGLKRKPFFLFTGTLLLLKIPNHYIYNRKNGFHFQALIHDISLVILCYSAALVKQKHVYLIQDVSNSYFTACVISKWVQNYLSSTESPQPVEEDPEVLTQSDKILNARSWLTKHLIWAATPSHVMGLSATSSTTETTEREEITVELGAQNLDSLFSSGNTETSKSFPNEQLSSLSSFLSISEIYGFMDSLDKDTIPGSERFEEKWTQQKAVALLMDHKLSYYLLPESLENTLQNLERNEDTTIAELFNQAQSFLESLKNYSERERYIGVNRVFKKCVEKLSSVSFEDRVQTNADLSRFLNNIQDSLPFLSYIHTLSTISNINLHFITSRAVNLKFLNIQKPFDFPSPEIPEGTDRAEDYRIRTEHETNWLIGCTDQINHLEVLALDDELPVKGYRIAQTHQNLIAFDLTRSHAT